MVSVSQVGLNPSDSLEIDPCGCMFGDEVPAPISQYMGKGVQQITQLVKAMKKDINTMRIALGNPECPTKAKILLAAALIYALCPIDLIPDCIPVFGLVDDVVICGALLWAARKSIPEELWKKCQEEAEGMSKPKKTDWRAIPVFAALWVGSAVLTFKIGKKLFGF